MILNIKKDIFFIIMKISGGVLQGTVAAGAISTRRTIFPQMNIDCVCMRYLCMLSVHVILTVRDINQNHLLHLLNSYECSLLVDSIYFL